MTASPLWLRYLAVGLLAVAVYYLLPAHGGGRVSRVLSYCAISASAAVAVSVGVRRYHPRPRRPWLLIVAGQTVYAVADATFYISHYLFDSHAYPAPSDLFYLAHYPLVVVGLALLVRHRTPGRDVPSLLDAATLGVTAATLSWLYLISPNTRAGLPLSVEAASVAYPVMDLALLAVGFRLVLGAGRRPASFFLLIGSLGAVFTADTLYVLQQVAGTYHAGNYLDAIWLAANLLLGAAALHPTMDRLGERSHTRDQHLGTTRITMLLGSVLIAPAVLVASRTADDPASVRLVAATCGVAFVLTIARMYGLVSDQRRLAITDGLTGLRTRRFLEMQLSLEIARTLRGNGMVGLFIVDVDHFKSINDRFGHPAGDRALAEIASRLRTATRREDVLARYGGEEFALLAPHLTVDDLVPVAERLRQEVARGPIAVTDDVWVAVTVSVGAAACPSHASEERALISVADAALYAAKAAGRDRVVVGTAGTVAPVSGTEERPTMSAYLFHVADDVDATLAPQEHSRAVGRWSRTLAIELGLDEATVRRSELGGRLHDIGKIVIPKTILAKPEPLDDEEWAQMRAHASSGARMVQAAPGLAAVADIIGQHHERVDGLGYPAGLTGPEILIEARIVAVCDAWAAMRTDRAYRGAMTFDQARAQIEVGRGTHFDPDAVDAFLGLLDHGTLGDLRPLRPS